MEKYRQYLEQEKGQYKALRSSLQEEEKRLIKTSKKLRDIEKAIPLVQLVVQQTQEELRYHLSELVTLALNAVFEDPYEFSIDFVTRRGKTEADLTFNRRGTSISPFESSGGGAIDVASFALRIALWKVHSGEISNTLIFDEPGRFISIDKQEKFGTMMKMLSDKLGLQFILITHSNALVQSADKVFKVEQKKGISRVDVI